MRISREDGTDLGCVLSCLVTGAIDTNDVSSWASRAIAEEDDPPVFLYMMLDLKGMFGKELREEIGFEPGRPDFTSDDYHHLRQIAVRRSLKPYSYLGDAAYVRISPRREKYINDLFMHNFSVDVDRLPRLEAFSEG